MKTFTYVILFSFFLFSNAIIGQTCNGNTFSSPGAPATCTYTYDSGGWNIVPPGSIGSSDVLCILADNATDFNVFGGTLYIAPGVTYSGDPGSMNSSSTLIVQGTASFSNEPPVAGTVYIEQTGVYNAIDTSFSPTGVIHNAGTFNVSNDLSLGGSVTVYNYDNAIFNVQGNASVSKPFSNCGLIDVFGDLNTTGSGGLTNLCSVWIHGDMTLNSDYYSDSLIVLEGTLNFNGADFYNNDILFVNNITLNNDNLYGNNETSLLIVKNNATLAAGASITGHYYYDMDDGGGFDSVCGSCTEDIDIVNVAVPSLPGDLVAECGDNIVVEPPVIESSIDFDGVDDYAQQINSTINGLSDYTISFWFKYDGPHIMDNSQVFVMGQRGLFEVYISKWTDTGDPEYQTIGAYVYKTDGLPQGKGSRFQPDNWTHFTVTVSHSGGNTVFNTFRNGYPSSASTVSGTIDSNTNPFRLGIINGFSSYNKFTGAVDEVKIFDQVLTDDQIKGMIYQEIEQNGSNVRGKIIPKDIEDLTTKATVPWSDLQAYYPMTSIISDSRTDDYSKNSNPLKLFNITTFQAQEAPMPYQTTTDGDWSVEGTWLHGDVWDIEDLPDHQAPSQIPDPWSIVQIHHNVTTSSSHSSLGLFIDPDKTLTVNGDNSISNNWYLQLDGTLDLADDAQLVQSMSSDLVTSATAKILRRQQGNTNVYWYNYWASPVGSQGVSSLSDNNAATNNGNNTPFKLNSIKKSDGTTPFTFTTAYDQVGMISTQWLYNFQNGLTYYDWVAISETTDISPGYGYTQKGTGNAGTEQEYTFVGKPNNGTILIAADDVDGDSANESEQDVTLTTTMIGNPYPSALDADEFIRDNIDFDNGGLNPIIQGTILIWEQWAGTSHWLSEYEGGYGYINLTETARAYQHPDIVIADPTNTDNRGVKTPTKFLPVGQAFFVEVVNDGNIEFNNGQRVFKQESLNESAFFRAVQSQDSATNEDMTSRDEDTAVAEPMQTIKLEFAVSNGATRQFVLGFSDITTDEFDPGYDGGLITQRPEEDMTSLLNGEPYVIQAFSPISPEKEIDLYFNSSGTMTYFIDIVELKNISDGQDIYIRDNRQSMTWNLTQDGAYHFSAFAGEDSERFDIVFSDENTLSNDELKLKDILIYFNNPENKLFVKGLEQQVKQFTLTNMLGQTVKTYNNIDIQDLENGVSISELSAGVYFVNLTTVNNIKRNKKIIME